MAYRTYQPDRRRRRRRLLLILLTTALIIAAIAYLVSRETEQRGTVEFFAAADDASALHEQAATLLTETLGEIGLQMPRQEVTRRLDEVRDLASEADELLTIDVPPSVGVPYGHMTAASKSWEKGSADLERAILAIMDGNLQSASEVQIENALDTLKIGDVGYLQFLAAINELPDEMSAPDFAVVAYLDPDQGDPGLYDAQNLALRIAAAYNLAPQHDVGVVGMVDPSAVGERGGIPLVPFAEFVGVNAVVSNVGNEAESNVAVELEILDVDSGESSTIRKSTGAIAAGASTTVPFERLEITPDGLYQVTLSVTIADDTHPDNDAWSMTFIWNNET
jgi:hypothetical protein